eukprot:m.15747 g.15747  ORF g.15747 m.15747 type:complete len:56 (+) comp10809_c0_seq1:76-243(+)
MKTIERHFCVKLRERYRMEERRSATRFEELFTGIDDDLDKGNESQHGEIENEPIS